MADRFMRLMKNDINERLDQMHRMFNQRMKQRRDWLGNLAAAGERPSGLLKTSTAKKPSWSSSIEKPHRRVMFLIDDEDIDL